MEADGTIYAVVSDAQGRIHVSSTSMKVTVGGCS
jgi:predicted secreted protein